MAAFLAREAPFPAIAAVMRRVLEAFGARRSGAVSKLDDVLAVDAWARQAARERLAERFGARAPAEPAGTLAAAPGGRA